MPDPAFSADRDAALAGVSRETAAALDLYVAELQRWQAVKNLVGHRTLPEVWSRHVADSLQLAALADGDVWADLGSGAGFPGMVVALAGGARQVHLVESDGRKAAFLRQAARLTRAPVRIWNERVEAVVERLEPVPHVVTARALAPLTELLGYAETLLMKGAVGLFPKGRDFQRELTEAAESWRFDVDVIPSRVESAGRILRIRDFGGRLKRTASGSTS